MAEDDGTGVADVKAKLSEAQQKLEDAMVLIEVAMDAIADWSDGLESQETKDETPAPPAGSSEK